MPYVVVRSLPRHGRGLARRITGDTCHLDLDLGFGLILSMSCRVYGINAPELATPEGPPARDYAAGLAPAGSQVKVTSHGWDKYGGRFLGEITLPGGGAFAQAMIGAGHAKPYFGQGPKPV
jgi:endonuclease YncB( thermonuclease family)